MFQNISYEPRLIPNFDQQLFLHSAFEIDVLNPAPFRGIRHDVYLKEFKAEFYRSARAEIQTGFDVSTTPIQMICTSTGLPFFVPVYAGFMRLSWPNLHVSSMACVAAGMCISTNALFNAGERYHNERAINLACCLASHVQDLAPLHIRADMLDAIARV